MPVQMKTPGVYIAGKNGLPPAVAAVETAVPAFVGHTRFASFAGKPLAYVPTKVRSMSEFETAFGGAPTPKFTVEGSPDATDASTRSGGPERAVALRIGGRSFKVKRAEAAERRYRLWYAMRLFFDNGGGPCFIVSVGGYDEPIVPGSAARPLAGLLGGIAALEAEPEPTILVIPDAVSLERAGCIAVQRAMLAHCGEVMKNRVAILDIHDGDQPRGPGDPLSAFRDAIGSDNLGFGAAYYPWLNTAVVQDRDVTYLNFSGSMDKLLTALSVPNGDGWANQLVPCLTGEGRQTVADFLNTALPSPYADLPADQQARIGMVNELLVETLEAFKPIRAEAVRQLNIQPPSAAMAGLYAFVDASRGVWKAPANVAVNDVVSPCVPISELGQQDLNVAPQGKSINAIRAFAGRGVLVWGARTLDGNSPDWRYINVRRTVIFIEQSCRLATGQLVFEPNEAGTWYRIRLMIGNFLTSVWRDGGLAGAKPEDAFAVRVGLGETMTQQDILEGRLRVVILVAMIRPAEFIQITFDQQMRTA